MATTLPSFTRTIDNAFVNTWYDIKPDAVDNILNATVVWAALNNAGCLKPQEGSELITRTIRYGQTAATDIQKGDLLPVGDTELETMAIWKWRTTASQVTRNLFTDQQNRGKYKIKDYVGQKLTAARDGLEQKYESNLFGTIDTAETNLRHFQGLHDMVPPIASRTTGSYGGINRPSNFYDVGNGVNVPGVSATDSGTNGFWGPKYLAGTYANLDDALLTDMKKLFNTISANQSDPNLILGTQELWETYEEFALDAVQIVKDESTFLADLGFQVLRFKGKPFIWSSLMTAKHMLMLNTDFIEVVYDPGLWFDMTDWKAGQLETDRIAHIVCFANMISDQLRRHGRLEYS